MHFSLDNWKEELEVTMNTTDLCDPNVFEIHGTGGFLLRMANILVIYYT